MTSHDWFTSEGYDGGLHHCKKCKLQSQGERLATPCPVSDAEHHAVAWLGQAGLYTTRLDAVANGEQRVQPLSAADVIAHARRYLYLTRHRRQDVRHTATNINCHKADSGEAYTDPPAEVDAAVDRAIERGRRA